MESSSSPSNRTNNSTCTVLFTGFPFSQHFHSELYGMLIAVTVTELVSCPITIFLNALVMVAVKTKRRLQTHLNILLASLALTDLLVGLVAQPLHITMTIYFLQGKHVGDFCEITSAFFATFFSFGFLSLVHLALISGERHLAIKYPFIHSTFITKPRLMVATILMWLLIPLRILVTHVPAISIIVQGVIVSSIILLQVLVYRVARRHEKQILSQQVSLEARAKFEKEKKALKLTTVIALAVGFCYFPSFIALMLSRKIFGHMQQSSIFIIIMPMILNSLLNPVIYTIRKKPMRIAFIELLLRKNFQEAEKIERRLFGSRNIVVPETQDTGQSIEAEREQSETSQS